MISPHNLEEILNELKEREPIFHHPEKFGKTKVDILNQVCEEFWEVGASGNVYQKQNVLDTLLVRYQEPNYQDIWEAKDFHIMEIATDNYLLTYILTQNKNRVTRRSTIWRKVNNTWKILFHQGTEVVDDLLLTHQEININTRKYQPSDAQALADIYYHTIHNVNARDYSEAQINAWAPESSLNLTGWKEKWSKLPPIVALSNHEIVGFAEFESNGHIDCFYVHHKFQGKSVGTCLMNAIEREANANNIKRIYAEVSITAKPFFEKKGFAVIKQQIVVIRGCELTNFVMEKSLVTF